MVMVMLMVKVTAMVMVVDWFFSNDQFVFDTSDTFDARHNFNGHDLLFL